MMSIDKNNGMTSQQGNITQPVLIKTAIMVVLLAWLVLSAIQLFNFVWVQPDHALDQPNPLATTDKLSSRQASTNNNKANGQASVNLSALLTEPLFDEVVTVVKPEKSVEPPKEEVLVETQLNLTLKGLFSAPEPEQGQAIIANGRKEDLYAAGDEIEGLNNVKLLAVYKDRVTLDNRGVSEVLYLYAPDERLQSSTVGALSDSAPLVTSGNQQVTGIETQEPAPVVANNNVKKLNEIMRVVRERDKTTGEMLGFRVLPGRDREGFERSGLKVNDVITSIDGDKLTDLRTAMAIYRKKRDVSQVSLILQRDGSEISLDIDLTALNI